MHTKVINTDFLEVTHVLPTSVESPHSVLNQGRFVELRETCLRVVVALIVLCVIIPAASAALNSNEEHSDCFNIFFRNIV